MNTLHVKKGDNVVVLAGNEKGNAVATTADGRSFVVGQFVSTVDFGGASLAGSADPGPDRR